MTQEWLPWIRLWAGANSDLKLLQIADGLGIQRGLVSNLWISVLLHAGQTTPRGSADGFDAMTAAFASGMPIEDVTRVIEAFRGRGLIGTDGRLSSWDKRQPKREDETATKRKREQRVRDKANGHDPDPPERKKRHAASRDVTQDLAASHDVTPRHEASREVTPESESESESDKQVDRQTDGPRAREATPLGEFWDLGLRMLGEGSRGLLNKVLELKGSPERALSALHHAGNARDPWKYLGVVLSDPPYDHAAAKGVEMFASIREAAAREDARRENVVKLRRRED